MKTGAWSGPMRVTEYSGRLQCCFKQISCSWDLYILPLPPPRSPPPGVLLGSSAIVLTRGRVKHCCLVKLIRMATGRVRIGWSLCTPEPEIKTRNRTEHQFGNNPSPKPNPWIPETRFLCQHNCWIYYGLDPFRFNKSINSMVCNYGQYIYCTK